MEWYSIEELADLNPDITLRRRQPQDDKRIHQIEWNLFSSPWSEDDFQAIFSANHIETVVAVKRDSDYVVGYLVYEVRRRSVSIMNIGIDEDFQRQKVGTKLIDWILDRLTLNKRKVAIARIRETEDETLSFAKKLGFKWAHTYEYMPSGENSKPTTSYVMKWQLQAEEPPL